MAGTVTITETRWTKVKKLVFAWTASAGGAADGTTSHEYDGKLLAVQTIPDGSLIPTDDYDITLCDADGHDVLLGQGTNRDTANTESLTEANLGAVAQSTLTLNVTNAGTSTAGVCVVWLR